MHTEPSQIAIEVLSVLLASKVAIRQAPVGDRTAHTIDQLLNALLAFGRADFAIEILAHDHVGGQLAPIGRNFGIVLLEEHLAVFAFDRGATEFPVSGLKRVNVRGTEDRIDPKRFSSVP